MEIMDRILWQLSERGKTQRALCTFIGISEQVFTDWKAGRNKSYLRHIAKISELLGVSVDYLLGTMDEKEKPSGNTTEGPITPKDQIINEIVKNLKSSSLDEVKRFDRMLDAFLADRRK